MLGKHDLMAFVATTNPATARPFYEDTLGLTVIASDNYAITFDANGIRLRLATVREKTTPPYSILSWVVPDIHAKIAGLAAKGVVFEVYDGFGQDKAGVWTAPGGTMVAWFKDPDGNLLSLTQF